MSNRLFAIGDVHGCLETLKALIQKLELRPSDKVVFVGDYIDRGPDSKGVLDYVMSFDRCSAEFLMGNHEKMLLNARSVEADPTGEHFDLWYVNGGKSALESFGVPNVSRTTSVKSSIDSKYLDWIKDLKITHVEDKFVFVHAGFRTNMRIMDQVDAQNTRTLLWTRSHMRAPFRPEMWENNLTVVCGHTPRSKVLNRDFLINVDTGSCFNQKSLGTLSAMELNSRTVISQDYIG